MAKLFRVPCLLREAWTVMGFTSEPPPMLADISARILTSIQSGIYPPEVQNRGISGPMKRTYVLQKFLGKKM